MVAKTKPAPAKKPVESSDDSSSEEETPKVAPKKAAAAAPAKAAPAKKAESSSDDSSDEEAPKKPAAKAAPAPAKATPSKAAPAKAAPAKKAESSSDDSSEEEEEEEEKPAKKAKKDEDEEEEEEDEEEEDAPVQNNKRKNDDAASTPSKKAAVESSGSTSVFVSGLPWAYDDAKLKKYFAGCGKVTSATVITDRSTGRSKGFGYVEFEDAAGVQKALAKNGEDIEGRSLKVDVNNKPKGGDTPGRQSFGDSGKSESEPSSSLFIGNLSFNTTQESLQEAFGSYEPTGLRVATDRETGNPRGFGYVDFADVDTAKKVLEEMNGADVDGRQIRLDFAGQRDANKSPGGFRGGRGGFGGDRGGFRGGRGGFGGDRGGRGGFGGRGGGFGGRGGRGGFGDRGGRGGGRGRGGFGDRGGRGGAFKNKGSIQEFQGSKVSFDD